MFFGKCSIPLSEKHELTLPAHFREKLSKKVYLTQGFDKNLYLLSQEAFNTITAHIGSTSISDPLSRMLRRLLLGAAIETSLDDKGKIELPDELCEYAGLNEEIVLAGQGEYLEIWSSALWQEQLNNIKDHDANSQRFEKFDLPLG